MIESVYACSGAEQLTIVQKAVIQIMTEEIKSGLNEGEKKKTTTT